MGKFESFKFSASRVKPAVKRVKALAMTAVCGKIPAPCGFVGDCFIEIYPEISLSTFIGGGVLMVAGAIATVETGQVAGWPNVVLGTGLTSMLSCVPIMFVGKKLEDKRYEKNR